MANKMRWRYGDTNPVMIAVASETTIEIGDIVARESGAAVPAGALPDAGSEAGNQEALHDAFLGVAMQHSPAGSTDPIRVATSGVFEFDCAAATFQVGDLVGVDEASSGSALENQVVAKVATANLAIGTCVRQSPSAASRVLIEVVSTVVRGGPQTPA
ncbi:MAG TPA: capsid cement protein [Lacipirellulaceae bacterium]|nr:capsid cement protein [Lacipirellulaceae bacterium]